MATTTLIFPICKTCEKAMCGCMEAIKAKMQEVILENRVLFAKIQAYERDAMGKCPLAHPCVCGECCFGDSCTGEPQEYNSMHEYNRHTGVLQMEEAVVQAAGMLLPMIGKFAKDKFGQMLHDTPPVKLDEAGDFALVNLPKHVASMALHVEDVHPDQSAVLSTSKELNFMTTSILERCMVKSRLQVLNWKETDAAGAALFRSAVNPSICLLTADADAFATYEHTALSYYSLLYGMWRGGIRFTIECLPTRFHQGQLYLAFNPNLDTVTLQGARNCTAATIDLGLNNRTTLDIPFVTQTDYLSLPVFAGSVRPATINDSVGSFTIFVQNPLISNGSVVTNIDVNVYIEALPDFEFKVPRALQDSTEIYQNGSWQMNEEVNRKELVEPPTHSPQQPLVDTTDVNVAISANVVTADTQNILEREYMLNFGSVYEATSPVGTLLSDLVLPNAFWSAQLATRGLYDFHELYRMDFKVTLRINPTSFHQGALLFVWIPLNMALTQSSFGTYTQFPHAILNIAAETSASFIVPFSAMTRFLRVTNPSMGNLKVFVWNVLKAPSAAPQKLTFSVWAQALHPHVAVKRQITAVTEATGILQMAEVSDTGKDTSTSQVAFKAATTPKTGFVPSDHMNVLTLLRRPCFVNSTLIVTMPSAIPLQQINVAWQNVPAFCGQTHCLLQNTYLASAGSNRITLTSNAGRTVDISGFAIPSFDGEAKAMPIVPAVVVTSPQFIQLQKLFNGGKQWQLAGEPEKVLEIPYYRRYPLTAIWSHDGSYPTGWPTMDVGYWVKDFGFGDVTTASQNRMASGSLITSFLFHSVGDDFMVYFPVCMPRTRVTKPTDEPDVSSFVTVPVATGVLQGEIRDQGSRLQLSGDVESNPGPDDDCCGFDKDVRRHMGEFQMLSLTGLSREDVKMTNEGIRQFLNKADDTMTGVETIIPQAKGALDSIQRTSEAAHEALLNFNKAMETPEAHIVQDVLASKDSKLMDFLKKWKQITEFVLNVVVHVYTIFKGGVMRYASLSALTLMLGGYAAPALMNQLTKIVQCRDDRLQSGEWIPIILMLWPTIARAAIGFFSFEFGEDETLCLSYRLREAVDKASGVPAMLLAGFEVWSDYMLEGFGCANKWNAANGRSLMEFSRAVAHAHATSKYTTLTLKSETVRLQLEKLMITAKRVKAFGPQCDKFNPQYLRDAERVHDWVRLKPNSEMSARCPPIGVAFAGPSATGKSFLAASAFPAAILMKLGLAQNAKDALQQVWNKPTGNDTHFYDGYAQQRIAYIDDFLKSVDAPDAHDVINMISASQYPVDMAKLEDKGMFFKSELVVVSTNTTNFGNVHGLTHAEALCTRFKHAFVVEVRPIGGVHMTGSQAVVAYSQELNEGEPKTMVQMIALVDKYWKFTRLTVTDGHRGHELAFARLLDEIADDYRRKHQSYDQLMQGMQRVVLQGKSVYEIPDSDTSCAGSSYENEIRTVVENVRLSVLDGSLEDYKPVAVAHLREFGVFPGDLFNLYDVEAWSRPGLAGDVLASLLPPKRRKWRGLLVLCGIAVSVGATAVGVVALIKWLVSTFTGTLQGAMYDGAQRVRTQRPIPRSQGNGLLEGVNLRMERVRKNVRNIQIFDEDEDMPVVNMHCICLGSKFILFPHHFWIAYSKRKVLGQHVHVRLENMNPRNERVGWFKIPLNATTVQQVRSPEDDGELDLCVAYCHSANINGVRKIEDYIPSRKEYQRLLAGREQSARVLQDQEPEDLPVRMGVREPILFTSRDDVSRDAISYHLMVAGLSHGSTVNGDCGRPYLLLDESCMAPLVAMHSAKILSLAGAPLGATPLILEDIRAAMNSIEIPKVKPLEVKGELQGDRVSNKFWTGELHTEGKTNWNGVPLSVWTPTTTDKRRWLEHPEWEDKFLPSCKKVVGERHALYTNAQKCAVRTDMIVPHRIMRMTVEHYVRKFPVDRDIKIFSEMEMINGVAPMQPLMMNTSCGFVSKWFKNGKKELFDEIEQPLGEQKRYVWSEAAYERIIPVYGVSFVDRLYTVEKDMLCGEVPFMPWVATMKDELRPIAKVEQCKTRVFEQPPLEFSLLMRKHFGAFANWVKSNPGFDTHSAIGIDKEEKWRSFYVGLREKGSRGFDVDYSNYDGSVTSQAFDFFRMITDRYYGNESEVRHALLHILQNSWVIVGDQLMHTTQGNKSGNPLTDLFNSLTNVWLIYVCYLNARVISGLSCSLAGFDQDVAMLTYGDDVIIAADTATLGYFDRKVVAECAQRMGYTVTAANKSDVLTSSELIEDLTFLKSRFVPDGAIVRAPMPKEVAVRELQFIDRHNVHDTRIQRDIQNNAVRFRAHDGREASERIIHQLGELGKVVEFDYDDFRLELYDKQVGDSLGHLLEV